MENIIVQMNLIGYHHFKNKEGTEEYHIVQCAYYKGEEARAQMKATIIPIFVDLKTFQLIANMTIGSALNVEVVPNLETGKIRYKVLV